MKGCKVGYVRVSSIDQNPARQLDGLDLHHTFLDRQSGKDRNRPQLEELLRFIRMGDIVCVHSMDRLARNLEDLLSIVKEIIAKDCSVHFIKENIILSNEETNPMSKLLLSVMGAISEFERALLRQRQQEGIEIAKQKGIFKGRKAKFTIEQAEILKQESKVLRKRDIMRKYNISAATVYKYLKEANT